MEFSNLFFLYLFLPLSVGVYFLMPNLRAKNTALLSISLLFYSLGQVQTLPILLVSAVVNFIVARWKSNRAIFIGVVLFNLGLLAACKLLLCRLPLGISFYTFSMISYQADVFCKRSNPCKSFSNFLLFTSLFPKLLMGPIVRYEQLAPQLSERKTSARECVHAVARFAAGLGKKVLIADYAFSVYEQLQLLQADAAAWLGALFFMFYIYFEFSGCADMAIGLGNLFGFHFPENFRLPYLAGSVSDFWRRWHISLGSFFRDYVYIPIGGSRKGRGRQILNLLLVWLLTGLWHGTSLNYILWGVYFFLVLAAEKQFAGCARRLPRMIKLLFTQMLVLIGWRIFSTSDVMSLLADKPFWSEQIVTILQNALPLLLLCFLAASSAPKKLRQMWCRLDDGESLSLRNVLYAVGLFVFVVTVLLLCTASLLSQASKPSLYASF